MLAGILNDFMALRRKLDEVFDDLCKYYETERPPHSEPELIAANPEGLAPNVELFHTLDDVATFDPVIVPDVVHLPNPVAVNVIQYDGPSAGCHGTIEYA